MVAELLYSKVIRAVVLRNHHVDLLRNVTNFPHGPEKRRKKGKIRKYVK
jgi:hypothetical protein